MTPRRATFTTPRTVPWYLVGDEQHPDTVVLVLHGLGQRAADLAQRLAPTAGPGRLLVVPEALSRYLPHPEAKRTGAAWFSGTDPDADLSDTLAYLDALWTQVRARYPARRRVLVGFSQGGHAAVRWLAQHPEHAASFDRVVLWGTSIPRDVDPAALGHSLSGAELVVAVGDEDPYATPENLAFARAQLDALDRPFELFRYAGAHEVAPAPFAEVAA